MGLFDALLGKSELEPLKAELARQTARADQALQDLRIFQQKASACEEAANALEETNANLLSEVAGLQAERKELLAKIESLESELIQAWELDSTLKSQIQKSSEELQQTRENLAVLQMELETVTRAASELKAENVRLSLQIEGVLSKQAILDQQFVDRETRLQVKSQRLQDQQTELVARQSALLAKEKTWKTEVEPRLRDFEAYRSLEQGEDQLKGLQADIAAKAAALNQKEISLEQLGITAFELAAREKTLNERSAEISEIQGKLIDDRTRLVESSRLIERQREQLISREQSVVTFQKRIDQLDDEAAALKKRQDSLDRKESRYQRDLEKRREEIEEEHASLRALKGNIQRREDALAEREREVERIGEQLQAYRQANTTLREQLSATKSSLEDCLRSRSRLPGFGTGSRTTKEELEDDYTPLPPVSKPSLALRSNSPLTGAGYHVGNSGIDDEAERRQLLELFIATPLSRLPKVGDSEYMKLWGEANTRIRIRYVAYHIYWNIEFQGARETMEIARDHWLRDLRWLKRTYSGKLPADHWPDIPRN
jgi:chromosome segregation ATPase